MIWLKDFDEVLTLEGVRNKGGRHTQEVDLTPISRASILVQGDRVVWVGPSSRVPKALIKNRPRQISMRGKWCLPGLVECHTHLVYAGSRSNEFEMRLNGRTYQEIAEAGGGIKSTVGATRKAKPSQLLTAAQSRVDHLTRQGVTSLEVKSGYGLNLQNEIKLLKVARALRGPRVIVTYLGPHAVSPEHSGAEAYLDEICEQHLPKIKKLKLADRVDIFLEKGYFSIAQGRRYFETSKKLGFAITAHADQLNRTGAGVECIRHQAQSADHLIQISREDILALASSEVTSVLLPAADFYLKMKYPPARELIDAGARVALATDTNPGSSPAQDVGFTGLLARLHMGMTLPEVIGAYTVGGAFALGLQDQCGALMPNYCADLAIGVGSWRELFYRVGESPFCEIWRAGKIILKVS